MMEKVMKYIKTPLILFGLLAVYILGFSLLNYFGILSLSGFVKVDFVVLAISLFILGFIRGKKASKKGYLEGLKVGLIAVLVFFILNVIFYRNFSASLLLYYIVLTVSSTIGSMIGINLRH